MKVSPVVDQVVPSTSSPQQETSPPSTLSIKQQKRFSFPSTSSSLPYNLQQHHEQQYHTSKINEDERSTTPSSSADIQQPVTQQLQPSETMNNNTRESSFFSRKNSNSNCNSNLMKKDVLVYHYEKTLRSILSTNSNSLEMRHMCDGILSELAHCSNMSNANTDNSDNASGSSGCSGDEAFVRLIRSDPVKYFTPLLLACAIIVKNPVKVMALDCIQKMLSNGCLDESRDEETMLTTNRSSSNFVAHSFGETLVCTVCNCENQSARNVALQNQILKTVLSIVLACDIHGKSLSNVAKTCFSICVEPKSVACRSLARTTLLQILNLSIQKMDEENPDSDYILTQSQKDVALLMRVLCNLATRQLGETNHRGDIQASEVRMRKLALSLIGQVIEHSTDTLAASYVFESHIKRPLTYAVLTNIATGNQQLVKKALNIFVLMMVHFLRQMKAENEMLMRCLIHILNEESNLATPYKSLILEALIRVFKEESLALDVFGGYDCFVGCFDVYQNLVSVISNIVTKPIQEGVHKIRQIKKMKNLSSDLLVVILRSLYCQIKEYGDPDSEFEENLIQKLQTTKKEFAEGVAKFNEDPEEGRSLLVQSGILNDEDTVLMAHFLYANGLEKSKIGQYIGSNVPFNSEVRCEFIGMQSFSGQDFGPALSSFLKTVSIDPNSESAEVILSDFALKYCAENPESNSIFANERAACSLAHALIKTVSGSNSATTTSLKEFLCSMVGQNDGSDFHEDYLLKCYEWMNSRESKLGTRLFIHNRDNKENSEGKPLHVESLFRNQQIDQLNSICEQYGSMHCLFNRSAADESVTVGSYIRAMFQALWNSVVSSSLLSECHHPSNNEDSVNRTLSLIEYCMHLSARCGMEEELNLILAVLMKVSDISNYNSHTERTAGCLKVLFKVVGEEGNFLNSAWIHVFNFQTQIVERLRMDAMIPNSIEHQMFTAYSLDLWLKTSQLNDSSLLDFVRRLCNYLQDVNIPQDTRLYYFMKLVDTLDYNLFRKNSVLMTDMWAELSRFFVSHILASNETISQCAIECLKQMICKVVDKTALPSEQLFSCYLDVVTASDRVQLLDSVLQSVACIMTNRMERIQSGWKALLQITALCVKIGTFGGVEVSDTTSLLVKRAFANLTMILNEYFHIVEENSSHIAYNNFKDCVACIRIFMNQEHDPSVSLGSIDLMEQCASKLIEYPSVFIVGSRSRFSESFSDLIYTDCPEHLNLWFPILSSLARVSSIKTCRQAYAALERIMQSIEKSFSKDLYNIVLTDVIEPWKCEQDLGLDCKESPYSIMTLEAFMGETQS